MNPPASGGHSRNARGWAEDPWQNATGTSRYRLDLRIPLTLALLTGGGLLFEIAVTRVLSLVYFSAFSYLVLSLAVLGLGLGAAAAALAPALTRGAAWPVWAALASLSAVLTTLLAVLGAGWQARGLLVPLTALPFLFLGLAVTAIFSQRARSSPTLYLADLVGAGIGASLAIPLLDAVGGIAGMFAAALAPALAALLLRVGPLPAAAVTIAASAIFLQVAGLGLEVDLASLATPKPIRETLRQGGEVVATTWDGFARSDLVRAPGERYLIYLDGGAGSLVPDASEPAGWLGDAGALAFAVGPPRSAFLVGPGGGLDIALARRFGTERIVAAEVNRGAVELTRALDEHAGDLYGPGVELHLDDGRAVAERLEERFDLILLSQVISEAAEARGLALVENGLYTVESFGLFLDALAPGGRLALKLYDELTLTRALVTALAALSERGVESSAATDHLFAVLDTRASPPVPLLMVSESPLQIEQAVSWARVAEQRGLALLHVPGLLVPEALQPIAAGAAGYESLLSDAEVDLRPPRDDRPFFFSFEPGIPREMRPLALLVGGLLAVALALATVAAAGKGRRTGGPLLFALLGSGFMLLEVSLLQRTQLAVGHPSLALAVILAALLLGAAGGSGLARRVAPGSERAVIAASALAVAVLTSLWLLAWPVLAQALAPMPAAVTALLVAVTLLPIAIPLGAPFPLALVWSGRSGARAVAIAWTMNGLASVFGAVAATILALVAGFTVATLAAAATYLLAAAVALATVREG